MDTRLTSRVTPSTRPSVSCVHASTSSGVGPTGFFAGAGARIGDGATAGGVGLGVDLGVGLRAGWGAGAGVKAGLGVLGAGVDGPADGAGDGEAAPRWACSLASRFSRIYAALVVCSSDCTKWDRTRSASVCGSTSELGVPELAFAFASSLIVVAQYLEDPRAVQKARDVVQ
jgi:hypothetical protein